MFEGKKILIVDDDVEYQNDLSIFLASKGFFVLPTTNGADFLNKLNSEKPDIALVDKEIGFEDGFDLIHDIRRHKTLSNIPIIMITGVFNESTLHDAIQIGADDVLAKPLSLKDLELRLISVLRRSTTYLDQDKLLRCGEMVVNLTKHQLSIGEAELTLTRTEYKIISTLLVNRNQVVNREQLALKFLSFKNSNKRTIDVHINSIRKKMGDYGKRIKTVHGRGYLFHDGPKNNAVT